MTPFYSAFYYATNKKLNNDIEEHFAKFNDEIEVYLEQYKLTLESYLATWKEELDELKNKYEKEKSSREKIYNENISEDGDDQYAQHVSGLEFQSIEYSENKNKIKDKYENYLDLYSKSILVALFSLNEIYLNKICDITAKEFEQKIKLSDFNSRDYLTTPINYLKLVVGIQTENIDRYESKLKDFQSFRNKIIHADSVKKSKETTEILKKQGDKLEYDKKAKHFKIKKSKFITDFIILLKDFHEEIFWMLEEKQGNLITKNSLRFFFGLIDRHIFITNLRQIISKKKITITFEISSRKRNIKKSNGRLILAKSKKNQIEFLNQTENDVFQELSDRQIEDNGFDLKNCLKGLTLFNTNTDIKLTTY